jgi:hypothetical protein
MPNDDADDDNCDAPDAVYADLRRYVPAHPRASARTAPPEDHRIAVMDWLTAVGHVVMRRLRRA